jgi:hypothetical protein
MSLDPRPRVRILLIYPYLMEERLQAEDLFCFSFSVSFLKSIHA